MENINCAVKSETNQVCQGCLSNDRFLDTWKGDSGVIMFLLGHTVTNVNHDDVLLCWECLALLRKVQRFQMKIQYAQLLLQQSAHMPLSTLSCSQINNAELFIKHEESIEKYDNLNVDNPIFPQNITDSVKQEIDSEELEHEPKYDINEERYEDSEEHNKVIDKIPYKKFGKYLKITDNKDVDLENAEKYYHKAFKSEKDMDNIVQRYISGSKAKKRYRCKKCGYNFKLSVDFKRHNTFAHSKIEGPYTCQVCTTSLSTWVDLQTHWKQHNYVYKCNICLMESRREADMRSHVKSHTKLYTCCKCNVTFCSRREFSIHYKDLHKYLVCDYCGKTNHHKRTLLRHIRIHHTPAQCMQCKRRYDSYHSLVSHYRTVHPLMMGQIKQELAYCVECNKQYDTVFKYKRHLATAVVHTAPNRVRVPCPECGKIFSRKSYMNNHYKLFHMKKSKHYCQICDKYFSSAYTARKHKQYVHDKVCDPKTKICDICGRAFSTNRILINHRRTHTGERPHKCEHCTAAFAQLVALQAHTKTQHKRVIINSDQ